MTARFPGSGRCRDLWYRPLPLLPSKVDEHSSTFNAAISPNRKTKRIDRRIFWTLAVEPSRQAMSSPGYVDCALAFRTSRRMA